MVNFSSIGEMPAVKARGAENRRTSPGVRGAPVAQRNFLAGGFSVSIHAEPSEIETEWRDLERHAVATFFQTFDWCEIWCRIAASRAGEIPIIVAGRNEAGELVFVLPMAACRRFGGEHLGWLAQQFSSHNMGVYDRKALAAVNSATLRAILAGVGRYRRSIVAANFQGQPAMWEGISNPFLQLNPMPARNPLYVVDFPEGYDAAGGADNSKAARKKLRRKEARLREEGVGISIVAQSGAEKCRAFDAFAAQKSEQLSAQGFDSIYDREEIAEFFQGLLSSERTGPACHAYASWLGDELIAATIGVRHRSRYFSIMLSMTTGPLQRFSPGALLIRDCYKAVVDDGVTKIDFGAGQSGLKARWHCRQEDRFTSLLALRKAGWPAVLCLRIKAALEITVRSNRRSYQMVRHGLASLRLTRRKLSF